MAAHAASHATAIQSYRLRVYGTAGDREKREEDRVLRFHPCPMTARGWQCIGGGHAAALPPAEEGIFCTKSRLQQKDSRCAKPVTASTARRL